MVNMMKLEIHNINTRRGQSKVTTVLRVIINESQNLIIKVSWLYKFI